MTPDQFFTKYTNKYIDYDSYYGYQCMDLYRQFVKEVYGCQQSPPVSGAAKVWDTYNKDFFDRISNGPVNYPLKGDIVIWNTKAGGGYGHIAIAMDARSYDFNSFDQNWPVGSRCHKQPHNYTNVLGWLTPKKKDNIVEIVGQAPTTSETTPETSSQLQTSSENISTTVEGQTGSETPTEMVSTDGGDIRSGGMDTVSSESRQLTASSDVDIISPNTGDNTSSTATQGPQFNLKAFIRSIINFIKSIFG